MFSKMALSPFLLFAFLLVLHSTVAFERCLIKSTKYCMNYCCRSYSWIEYCCSSCHLSVRTHYDCLTTTTTTTRPPRSSGTDWWTQNGWWVTNGLRIFLPLGFMLVGAIIIGILICTGKIKMDRVLGRRRPAPVRAPAMVTSTTVYATNPSAADLPPSYTQATGASYPIQQMPSYPIQAGNNYPPAQPPLPPGAGYEVHTVAGPVPVQGNGYAVPPGGSYPVQQFANNYPPMEANPNYSSQPPANP